MNEKLYSILCTSLFLIACQTKPILIGSEELYNEFNRSTKDSAVSWWYLGEQGSYYYIAEKYPLKTTFYKVDKEDSLFTLTSKQLTYHKNDWVNIKTEDLKKETE